MKTIYLIVKTKDDFCRDEKQFKSILSSNVRFSAISEETLEVAHKVLSYSISLSEVETTNESIFNIEVVAKQEKEEEQVEALEAFDAALRRVNEKFDIFKINTIWDEISLYYGKKLYPEIVEIEALLREIIYLFMIKNVGSQWLKDRSSPHVKEELKKTAVKNELENYPDTDSLIFADFITLGYFFFEKYPMNPNINGLYEALKNKDNYTEEKMAELLDSYEPKSNWDRYFSDKIPVDRLNEKWRELYKYRNCVAHTKKISKSDYDKATTIIEELKPKFLACLSHLDDVELTPAQSEAIEEVAQQTIASSPLTLSAQGRDTIFSLSRDADASRLLASEYLAGGESAIRLSSSIYSPEAITLPSYYTMPQHYYTAANPELLSLSEEAAKRYGLEYKDGCYLATIPQSSVLSGYVKDTGVITANIPEDLYESIRIAKSSVQVDNDKDE